MAPNCLSRSSIKFQGHARLKFDFTDKLELFEMMHKAWYSIEEVPYCFSRLSVNFQGHVGQKFANFERNLAFPDC